MSNWVEREQLLFKSTDLVMIKIELYKKVMASWTYFASDVLLIIKIN